MRVGEGNKKQIKDDQEGLKRKLLANSLESQGNDAGDTELIILALIPGIVQGKADWGCNP